MSAHWISFTRLADSKGVPVEEVQKAVDAGEFGRALSKDGKRINADHSKAKAFLGGEYIPLARPGRPQIDPGDAPINAVTDPDEIQRIADAVVLVTEYGSPKQAHQWSKTRKEIAAAATAEAIRDKVKDQLIPRHLIESIAFCYLDSFKNSVSDLAVKVAEQVGDGSDTQRGTVEDLMGSVVDKARSDMERLVTFDGQG